ncbi:hypothetical protein LFAB_05075 [Lactiplantibacillus fabifermentans T30PCM01]|uniref:Uncharacterized protein n=1 Tax=Lactiplantibacillus fabifermentans T30PCM01 TaxID=1400520 RepID=W6TAC1_9LACO|nr:hypothetical protein LFAB_05075 [Lactiplantibacillus fabifermentans T30PCM01]
MCRCDSAVIPAAVATGSSHKAVSNLTAAAITAEPQLN